MICDLSPSMMRIAGEVFYNAYWFNDRFHVQQVYDKAVDEIRIDIWRQLIAHENNCDRAQYPTTYSNGETMRQILACSKHSLMMPREKWTDIQRHRANILLRHYPILKKAYLPDMQMRHIFNIKIAPAKAMGKFNEWYGKVLELCNCNVRSVIKTMHQQSPTISADVRPMQLPRLSTQRSKSLDLKCDVSETGIYLSFGSPNYTLDFNNTDLSI